MAVFHFLKKKKWRRLPWLARAGDRRAVGVEVVRARTVAAARLVRGVDLQRVRLRLSTWLSAIAAVC